MHYVNIMWSIVGSDGMGVARYYEMNVSFSPVIRKNVAISVLAKDLEKGDIIFDNGLKFKVDHRELISRETKICQKCGAELKVGYPHERCLRKKDYCI